MLPGRTAQVLHRVLTNYPSASDRRQSSYGGQVAELGKAQQRRARDAVMAAARWRFSAPNFLCTAKATDGAALWARRRVHEHRQQKEAYLYHRCAEHVKAGLVCCVCL